MATVCANLTPGLGHGAIGALISAWPALALAGSFELLMLLIRTGHQTSKQRITDAAEMPREPETAQGSSIAPSLAQTVAAWHEAGKSQRAIARELSIDRRKVKQIIDQAA